MAFIYGLLLFLAVLSVYKSYLPLVYLHTAGCFRYNYFAVWIGLFPQGIGSFKFLGGHFMHWSIFFFASLFDQLTSYMLIRLVFFLEVGLFFFSLNEGNNTPCGNPDEEPSIPGDQFYYTHFGFRHAHGIGTSTLRNYLRPAHHKCIRKSGLSFNVF